MRTAGAGAKPVAATGAAPKTPKARRQQYHWRRLCEKGGGVPDWNASPFQFRNDASIRRAKKAYSGWRQEQQMGVPRAAVLQTQPPHQHEETRSEHERPHAGRGRCERGDAYA